MSMPPEFFQLAVLLTVLVAVPIVIARSLGLRSKRFGWFFLGNMFDPSRRLRGSRGRFVSMRHLTHMSDTKRMVISAVAALDVASLAQSATALWALSLSATPYGDPALTPAALVVVTGVCVIVFAQVLHPLGTSLVIFLAAVAVTSQIASVSHSPWQLVGLLGLALSLLSPWPVGVICFGLECLVIQAEQGTTCLIYALVLAALVVALVLLVEAAKAASKLVLVGIVMATILLATGVIHVAT